MNILSTPDVKKISSELEYVIKNLNGQKEIFKDFISNFFDSYCNMKREKTAISQIGCIKYEINDSLSYIPFAPKTTEREDFEKKFFRQFYDTIEIIKNEYGFSILYDVFDIIIDAWLKIFLNNCVDLSLENIYVIFSQFGLRYIPKTSIQKIVNFITYRDSTQINIGQAFLESYFNDIRNYEPDLKIETQTLVDIINFEHKYPQYAIELSKIQSEILNLHDDWDGEGTKSYQKSTWNTLEGFLKHLVVSLNIKNNKTIDMPTVYPGDKGSIDLHWKNSKFELLIKFYEQLEMNPTYYGDNFNKDRIKGCNPVLKLNDIILAWLSDFI